MAITQELLKEINNLSTTEEVHKVWAILKEKHGRLSARKLDQFYVGQQVSFKGRHGEILTGELLKINQKTAKVKVGNVRWTVGGSLLTVAGA